MIWLKMILSDNGADDDDRGLPPYWPADMIITELYWREAQIHCIKNNESFLPRTGYWSQKWSIWCSSSLRGLCSDCPTCLRFIGSVCLRGETRPVHGLCVRNGTGSALRGCISLRPLQTVLCPLQTRTEGMLRGAERSSGRARTRRY